MKKLISLLLIAFLSASAQTVFGAVLVFKTTKEVDSDKPFELAKFATGNYSKIRIAVNFLEKKLPKEKPKDKKENFESSPLDELAKLELSEDASFFTKPDYIFCYAVEGSELFALGNCNEVIDVPPSKISIQAKGAGKYSIAVWGN